MGRRRVNAQMIIQWYQGEHGKPCSPSLALKRAKTELMMARVWSEPLTGHQLHLANRVARQAVLWFLEGAEASFTSQHGVEAMEAVKTAALAIAIPPAMKGFRDGLDSGSVYELVQEVLAEVSWCPEMLDKAGMTPAY